jgi:hypothetical protein
VRPRHQGSDPALRLTRRSLILAALAALGLDAPASGTEAQAPPPLPGSDLDDLLAFGEVLVAGAVPLPASERALLREHVDHRLGQGGGYYVDLYRTTVALLRRLGGARFGLLDPAERVALVSRFRLGVADVRPGESLGAFSEDVRAVRTRAAPDLLAGYYASAAGWAVVGYGSFPGQCGDLARYTRPEA